jgi:hypothetical protein
MGRMSVAARGRNLTDDLYRTCGASLRYDWGK